MRRWTWRVRPATAAVLALPLAVAVEEPAKTSSYLHVAEKRQADLPNQRYDLSDRPAKGVTMSRGKAVQDGVRVKLPAGTTWDALAAMSPAEIRDKNVSPAGFFPLPHPNHPEGGMVFPKFHIDEINLVTGVKLTGQEQSDLVSFLRQL